MDDTFTIRSTPGSCYGNTCGIWGGARIRQCQGDECLSKYGGFAPAINALIQVCTENVAQCLGSTKREAALNVMADQLSSRLTWDSTSVTNIFDCYDKYCPSWEIDLTMVHPKEIQACKVIHSRESIANWVNSFFVPPEWKDIQEFLRFRADDPRHKVLFLAAESDHNGAISPENVGGILSKLSQKYDLSYKIVKTTDDVRRAIHSAAKAGKLAHVIISGHGNPYATCLSNCNEDDKPSWDNFIHRGRTDLSSIFSGIQPNGKILFISCSVGADKDHEGKSMRDRNGRLMNLAQMVADSAKRTVIAPKRNVAPALTDLLSTDTTMLYHPQNFLASHIPFYNVNAFKPFKPEFKDCSSLGIQEICERELLVNKEIQNDLDSKSLLADEEKKQSGSYLGFCKDDPREKFLYLAAEHNKNNAFDPAKIAPLLGLLADQFDLKYQVVTSLNAICREVEKAAEFGKVAGVFIGSAGTPSDGLELVENGPKITTANDFSKCFSKIKKDGTIVFSGGSVGQNATNPNNLAQKIANDSRRTVLAPTCPIFPKDIEVQSTDPMFVYQAGWSALSNFLFVRCPENQDNLFKQFKPK